MDIRQLRKLIRLVETSAINELEVEQEGSRVKIVKSPSGGGVMQPLVQAPAAGAAVPGAGVQPPSEPAAELEESNLIVVNSPMVGTFYRAPSPGAPPFVEVGQRVSEGQTLCILEAMKLMNELQCESTGAIREICVENAQPVEFGQRLFLIEP